MPEIQNEFSWNVLVKYASMYENKTNTTGAIW